MRAPETSAWGSSLMVSHSISEEGLWPPACLHRSARAAITKYHRLGCLSNRYVFSHSFGGWMSKIKVVQVWPFSLVYRC